MWGPLKKVIISSCFGKKHGCHEQFLFLIGWNLKNLLWSYKFKWFVKYKSQQKLFISSCFGKHGCHGNCCFWLAETLIDWLVFNANFSNISAISWHAETSKVVSFEITSPTWTNYLLVGSNIYVRFSAKIHHFVLLWQKTWLIWAILVSYWLNY